MDLIDIKPLELKDALTILIATVTAVVGLWQYIRTSRRSFLEPIRQTQLKLYLDACSASACLATLSRDSEDWKQAKSEFLRLFYGPLAIVEDYDHSPKKNPKMTVERAMVAFKECLDSEESDQMEDLSLALAHTCRISLGASWDLGLLNYSACISS
jgi:hypothetical protein